MITFILFDHYIKGVLVSFSILKDTSLQIDVRMSCAGVHWGEEVDGQRGGGVGGSSSEDWGLNSADMEDILTPKPPLSTSPALYQPSQEETPSFQMLVWGSIIPLTFPETQMNPCHNFISH